VTKLKLKIIFLLSNFRAGGAETQFANLIKNIDRNKFEPVLGLIKYKNNTPTPEFLAQFGDIEIIEFRRKRRLDFMVVFRIRSFILKRGINIIQSQLFMDNQIARFSGLFSGRPVVTSVRGEIGAILSKSKMWFEFKSQFLSCKIVVNSKWLKDYVVNLGSHAEKIVCIYNGVDFLRYQCEEKKIKLREIYNIDSDAPVISIVARLHPMKDHITFLKTISILKKSYPDIVALIVGDGDEKEFLKQYVSEIGIESNVRFLGVIGDKLAEIYKITDVLLLTSQWGESFPNVILEAMSVSVPVVASNISAVPEIIDNGVNGFIVEKNNAEQFSNKILTLLSDSELSNTLIPKAREKVRSFDIPAMVKAYELLYESICS